MIFEIKLDSSAILAVFFALVIFGILYNNLVMWLENHNYAEGFLSLIVAGGVLGTLVGVAILSIEAALITLGAFVATGTPMIVGSISRYIKAREALKRAMLDEVRK